MALRSKFHVVGPALIDFWLPYVEIAGAGIDVIWAPGMRGAPAYPCSPREQLPRAFLRASRAEHEKGSVLGAGRCSTSLYRYQYSLWLQLRQTPGEHHQDKLLAATAIFIDAMLDVGLVPELNVDGIIDMTIENQLVAVIRDEQDHPSREPALRVSNAEISLSLIGTLGAS